MVLQEDALRIIGLQARNLPRESTRIHNLLKHVYHVIVLTVNVANDHTGLLNFHKIRLGVYPALKEIGITYGKLQSLLSIGASGIL